METKGKRLQYSGISLGAVLVMAFVLAQPTMNHAYAVGIEGLPAYDDCELRGVTELQFDHELLTAGQQPEDPISMNTVRNGNIVKTIHAEKEIFDCRLNQGNLRVIVDVTTYIELYENIADREVIASNAVAVTCIKDERTSTAIDCESKPISSSPVPVGSDCRELNYITHPQEMNTVNKGATAKTIEAQKEVFICALGEPRIIVDSEPEGCIIDGQEPEALNGDSVPFVCFPTLKKVEIILFTEVYENLATQTVTDVQFHSMRCVVLITNDHFDEDPEDDVQDATVETCQFSSIEN
ncbi:MAG: hypothetical protein HMLIMOIP_002472 [Candidatus Nitrosomirales archaeon]|jgi:hypothetical protein